MQIVDLEALVPPKGGKTNKKRAETIEDFLPKTPVSKGNPVPPV